MGRGSNTARGSSGPRDSGASLVEFALIAPLLVVLLLGTITGGIALSHQNSIKNAAREGVRFGAVNPVAPGSENAYLGRVLTEAVNAATGDLDTGVGGRYVCAAYVNETNGVFRGQMTSGTPSYDTGNLCFADGRTEERVQVLARRDDSIEAVFYSHSLTLEGRAVTRYER
jgi:hypothetical protein